jgi:hypothetical protein
LKERLPAISAESRAYLIGASKALLYAQNPREEPPGRGMTGADSEGDSINASC